MKKPNTFIVAAAVIAAVIAAFWLLLAAPGYTGNAINMTRGVTPQSVTHYQLHMVILWICVVIGVIVFSAMFISIVLHRKSRGHEAASFTHRRPPLPRMACAALVHRFISTWWTWVGSASTMSSSGFRSICWLISIVEGREERNSLRASLMEGVTCMGMRSSSLLRLKVRICLALSGSSRLP
jgi:type II secretory pathway component PulF